MTYLDNRGFFQQEMERRERRRLARRRRSPPEGWRWDGSDRTFYQVGAYGEIINRTADEDFMVRDTLPPPEPFTPVRTTMCLVPPLGWYCTREAGHDGPCAAVPIDENPTVVAPRQPYTADPRPYWADPNPMRGRTSAQNFDDEFTRLLNGPETPYIPSPRPNFSAYGALRLMPEHLNRVMNDKRNHLIHRLRNSRLDAPPLNGLKYNGDSLKDIMATHWLSRLLWRRRTRSMKRNTFHDCVPVRIKDEAPICWRGRSGYITNDHMYPESIDLVEVSLFGGVVGSPSWVAQVSIYDLVELNASDADFERTQWQRRIRAREAQQREANEARSVAVQAQERAAQGMPSGLHAIHPAVIAIAKEEGVYDERTVPVPLPRTRRKLRGL